MPIKFAVRGDNVDARYSTGGKVAGKATWINRIPANSVNVSETGMIGISYIDQWHGTTQRCGLYYPGANLWGGQPFSILFRGSKKAHGDVAMFSIAGPSSENQGRIGMFQSANGSVYFSAIDDYGTELLAQSTGNVGADLDVYHDWVMTCTGTMAANGFKIYRDNVLVFQSILSNAAPLIKDKGLTLICLGYLPSIVVTSFHVEEFVIWDEVINPASIVLTSYTGALNGASRTAFVDVPQFDAQSYNFPVAADIRSGTSFVNAGVAGTGTLASGGGGGTVDLTALQASVDAIKAKTDKLRFPESGVSVSSTEALVYNNNLAVYNVNESTIGSINYVIEDATHLKIKLPATAAVGNGDHIIFRAIDVAGFQRWFYIILAIDGVQLTPTGGFMAGPSTNYPWIYIPIATGNSADQNNQLLKNTLTVNTDWTTSNMTAVYVPPGDLNVNLTNVLTSAEFFTGIN